MYSFNSQLLLSVSIVFSLFRLNPSFTFQKHIICDRTLCKNRIVNNIKLQLSTHSIDQTNNQSYNDTPLSSLSTISHDTPITSSSTLPQPPSVDSKHDIITLTNPSSIPVEEGFYISCGSCKSVYLFKNAKEAESSIGTRGTRVKCSVCEKQWFQGMDKVTKTDSQMSFLPISTARAEEMKKFIIDNNWARNPRGEKIDLFIGNLPFNFDENDLIDLFAEYGVVGVALVRDADKQSKGFAFIELSSRDDADQAIEEMDGFFLDNQRKLVVKLSIRNAQGSPSPASGGTSSSSATPSASQGFPKPSDSTGTDAPRAPPAVSGGGGKSVWVPRGNR